MSAQFHTPSFGDEVVYDLTEGDSSPPKNTTKAHANEFTTSESNSSSAQQLLNASKRMRSMDQSLDEYHSANDESFVTSPIQQPALNSSSPTSGSATTLAARKQLTLADPNEPTKPLSAYALFFRDTVSAIKQQNPNSSFQELSRIVASMWEVLDESHKSVYEKKNEIARNEYLKQMRIYRQQQQDQQDELNSSATAAGMMQSKPAVFTITQPNASDSVASNQMNTARQSQFGVISQQVSNTTSETASNAGPHSDIGRSAPTSSDPSPQQMQMLTEAGSVQKCTRDNCNKRAIINPDWEDEYCSNECVVIHCRNVFNDWVQSNLNAKKQ